MRHFLVAILALICSSALAQSNVEASFDENVKKLALDGAKSAASELADRAKIAQEVAGRLAATPALSQSDKALLEASVGAAVAAQVDQSPKSGVTVLRQISTGASAEAKGLDTLAQKLVNQSPAVALTSLQSFAHGASQVAVTSTTLSNEQLEHPKPVELVPKVAILPHGTGGPTAAKYESVALLLFWDDLNSEFTPTCTGTLVGGGKILTAAHCFCLWEPGEPTQTTERCLKEKQKYQDYTRWRVFFQRAGVFSLSAPIDINPNFQLNGSMTRGDVAIATLAPPSPSLPQASLPSAEQGSIATSTIVGFGYSYLPATPGVPSTNNGTSQPGLKLWGNVSLSACATPFDGSVNYCWTSNPSSPSASICGGDSGGPLFLPSPNVGPGVAPPSPVVIGVNSAGIGDCSKSSLAGDTRLDSAVNTTFLQSIPLPTDSSPFTTLYFEDLAFLDANGVYDHLGIPVTKPASSIIVAVNGGTDASLVLQVRDEHGAPACTPVGGWPDSLPGESTCAIQSPSINSRYSVHVGGTGNNAFQLLVTGYP